MITWFFKFFGRLIVLVCMILLLVIAFIVSNKAGLIDNAIEDHIMPKFWD